MQRPVRDLWATISAGVWAGRPVRGLTRVRQAQPVRVIY